MAAIDNAIEPATVQVTVNDEMSKQKTSIQAGFQTSEMIEWE